MRVSETLAGTRMEARPYQVRVCSKTVDMFRGECRNGAGEQENAAKSVMIESPTGSGKTPMGLLAGVHMQQQHDHLLAWVAMRRNLLHQAAAENDRLGFGADINFLSMFQRELPPELLPENRSRPLMLVVDEAHHDAATTMAQMHNVLKPELVLGLSATPYRSDRVKLCFEKVVKDAGIHQLIQDGYLSRYHHYTIPEWSPEAVADFYAAEPERWGQSLMFFLTYAECQRCRARLESLGVACDVVTGHTDREAQIEALRRGHLQVLINMAVLTEGFNYPDLRTVWIRDSGKGPTVQMGGRVFRKADDPLLRFKQVVQSKNTDWPMIKTALPSQHYVWQENTWLTLRVNPGMERVAHDTRMAIAQIETHVPEFFKTRSKGKKVRAQRF